MTPDPKPPVPTEHQEQVVFFQWISYHPTIRDLTFAIPNGGSRHKLEAVNLKAEGVRAGVPDIFIALPMGKFHGLFIEMKRQKGGVLSDVQKGWIERLAEQGYVARVCKGFFEAKETVERYLLGNGYTLGGK